MGGASGLEAGTQIGQHLAEQVELLENRLERQPGMVDEEQLALVVAEAVPEGQRLVEEFLRAPNRQRGLVGELLQRRAVPVDRRIVEVGTELSDRVLGVAAHEELPAEPHDGLIALPCP